MSISQQGYVHSKINVYTSRGGVHSKVVMYTAREMCTHQQSGFHIKGDVYKASRDVYKPRGMYSQGIVHTSGRMCTQQGNCVHSKGLYTEQGGISSHQGGFVNIKWDVCTARGCVHNKGYLR